MPVSLTGRRAARRACIKIPQMEKEGFYILLFFLFLHLERGDFRPVKNDMQAILHFCAFLQVFELQKS